MVGASSRLLGARVFSTNILYIKHLNCLFYVKFCHIHMLKSAIQKTLIKVLYDTLSGKFLIFTKRLILPFNRNLQLKLLFILT